ncbi:hypothetical protein PG990_008409 [Apiospora arundinis]
MNTRELSRPPALDLEVNRAQEGRGTAGPYSTWIPASRYTRYKQPAVRQPYWLAYVQGAFAHWSTHLIHTKAQPALRKAHTEAVGDTYRNWGNIGQGISGRRRGLDWDLPSEQH